MLCSASVVGVKLGVAPPGRRDEGRTMVRTVTLENPKEEPSGIEVADPGRIDCFPILEKGQTG